MRQLLVVLSVTAWVLAGCSDSNNRRYNNPYVEAPETIDDDKDGVPLSADCDDNDPFIQQCNYGEACFADLQCITGACIDRKCGCTPAKFAGNACDQCAKPEFTGANCDQCANAWTGAQCDVCPPGVVGPNCNQCTNPNMAAPKCIECKGQFTGKTCDQCTNPGMALPECKTCQPQFTGELCQDCTNANAAFPDCTQCKDQFAGQNCDQCAVNSG